MESKTIVDSPALLGETLLALSEAHQYFPIQCSRQAVERWVRLGIRGVVLESALICGKRYTSREAIERFIRGQFQAEADHSEPGE